MDAETGTEGEPCSEEEVCQFFDEMPDDRYRDAIRYAKVCASGCQAQAHELFNEAFVRMAAGTRKCLRGEDLMRILLNSIRSLASDRMFVSENARIVRLKNAGLKPVSAADVADDIAGDLSTLDDTLDVDSLYPAVMAAIANDQPLVDLAEAIGLGFRGEDLETLLGVEKLELAALRRRLKRKALAARIEATRLSA
ncbi:hypothetical protein [Mesorhizobium sp.]|uniref:hypothetical protein n=1 Tax=Mesorhizobium sp. TaxID=1871066 RepID=UPI001209D726|nr:hypothetical protein [Mesorhizobium sp.]TJV17983.1 MAG: hypothetical protein E5Y07_10015 [Mesorhizobium sp.]